MEKVISKDGTVIAFEKSGHGQPLIIVGGSLANHRFYEPLAAELANYFTLYNFDRRGRGESGDMQPYAVDREIEDMAALIAHADAPVFVYGHSAGAALALRAAAANPAIAKLALADLPYTPHSIDSETAKAEFAKEAAQIHELHQRGDHKGSARFFLSGFGLSAHEVEEILHSPDGESMIACARALPYDYAMLGDGLVPTDLAAKVDKPTMILAHNAMPETAEAFVQLMPNAKLQLMDAPVHELSPQVVGRILSGFFGQTL